MEKQTSKWARPKEGRWIAGVCGGLASGIGGSTRTWRIALALAGLVGLSLAFFYAIFDIATFGQAASPGVRIGAIALGLLLACSYPLLALVMPDARRPRVWDFASSFAVIVLLVLVGQAVGVLLEPYWASAKGAWQQRGGAGWFTWGGDYVATHGFGLKDVVLILFALSAGGFLWIQRAAAKRFFRSMTTGVMLVVLTTAAVAVGVLVPQIDGFEDPSQRVDLAREYQDYQIFKDVGYQKLPGGLMDGHEQYQAFRWAEGYFLYHLLHVYGGMPQGTIPPQTEASLEVFGRKYGLEERDNRMKQMRAAFGGRAKVEEIGAFLHENEDAFWRFFEVSTQLHLNRTYKSHWFASLLFLLGGAVALNLFKGRLSTLLSLNKLGFAVVHVGVIALLLGGFVSKLFTDRGILNLNLGQPPQDVYWRHFDPRKPARMPFSVRLDEFARRDWPALEVHFFDEKSDTRVPRYTLWKDRLIELDYVEEPDGSLRPQLALRVIDVHDRTEVGLPFVSEATNPEDGRVPLVEVVVNDAHLQPGHVHEGEHDHTRRAYLFPLDRLPQPYLDPTGAYRIAAVYDDDPTSYFPDDGPPAVGFVEVTVAPSEMARPMSVPVRIGEQVEVAGGYVLRFADASADFGPGRGDNQGSRHPLPLEEQPDGFAAVWVDVIPPNGAEPERRIVLEDIDDIEHGRQAEYAYQDVRIRLRWDPWTAPGPPRHVLHWAPDAEPTLYSESGETHAVVIGEPLPLPGENPMIPRQFLHNATFEKNLTFTEDAPRADGWDSDFYSRTPRGLELEVIQYPGTDQEVRERVDMATTEFAESQVWFSGDERFVLVFLENSEMLPFEWRSVLSILEKDNAGTLYEVALGPEKAREIRVNDYFKYKGYRFFQTNAKPEDPTYSGIGVVYDPGIPIVLIGMYTIIAGTVIAFLIRPIRLGWRKVAKA